MHHPFLFFVIVDFGEARTTNKIVDIKILPRELSNSEDCSNVKMLYCCIQRMSSYQAASRLNMYEYRDWKSCSIVLFMFHYKDLF